MIEEGGRGRGPGRLREKSFFLLKVTDGVQHLFFCDQRDFIYDLANAGNIFGLRRAGCQSIGAGVTRFGGNGIALLPGLVIRRRPLGLYTHDFYRRSAMFQGCANSANQSGISHRHKCGRDSG